MPGGMLKYGGSYREGVSVFEYIYYEPANAAEAANEPDTLYAPVCDFKKLSPGLAVCTDFQRKSRVFWVSVIPRPIRADSLKLQDRMRWILPNTCLGKEQFYRSGSSVMNISFRYKSFDVQKQERTVNSAIYTKAQCFAGKTLFSWKMSRDIPAYPTATGTEWLKNPSAGQLTGGVGSAPKDLTGFISRQLKNAYEEGIAELAKIYGTRVQADSSYTTKDGRTVRRETDIKISFEQQFKPRISGVYIDEQSRMYVWVTAEEPSQSDSAGASSNPPPHPQLPHLKTHPSDNLKLYS
ncbi:hypothetical protein CHS0354_002083 [Potamilus streckersoni]|uniref:Uncharacterized protein n=1 Tax=Potamilus streckersoni TaxID=2493646 RepID=A0AAE0W8M2_9BIVA|nr:hypothetical protein CHS0354_002083 [Potamilus streckersoni]